MVISRSISGKVQKFRHLVMLFLFFIYLGLPWFQFHGLPLIRLNIPNRKFYLLGNIFAPEEGIFLFLFLLTLGLSLFFFTSLIGRVWCGWACPQTMFTELFDIIGRAVLGTKYGKKDAPKFKKSILLGIWILISVFASFVWVSYFHDPYQMFQELKLLKFGIFQETWIYYVIFFSATLFLDMTFVREQFCRFACPYARFQTVMMDKHSINVTYDFNRGEPRRAGKVKIGDCTACNMCLVVCPTGIDIREGVNVGCIACGKCIDACTIQMNKENKKSLIGYFSEEEIKLKQRIRKWIRPRTVVYGLLLFVVLNAASILYITRVPFYVNILPDRNLPAVFLSDEIVRNYYQINLKNYTKEDKNFELKVLEEGNEIAGYNLFFNSSSNQKNLFSVSSDSFQHSRLVIEMNQKYKDHSTKLKHIRLKIMDSQNEKNFKIVMIPFSYPKI